MTTDRTRRAIIAGASGFVGQYLSQQLEAEGYQIARVGRSGPDARWGDRDALVGLLDGADLVLNFSGKTINCRYTPLSPYVSLAGVRNPLDMAA